MQRLRDTEPDVTTTAELRRLAHAVADPEPPPGAQDRVAVALAMRGRHRPPTSAWRAPIFAAVALAIASAVVVVRPASRQRVEDGRATVAPAPPRVTSPPIARVATTTMTGPAGPAPAATTEATPEATPEGTTEAPREAASPDAIRRAPSLLAMRSEPRRAPVAIESPARTAPQIASRPTAEPVASGAEPSELVFRGLRALRQDHDIPAAARLLDEYRARFPHGDLAEEALALAIEAHAGLQDPTTNELADEYLRRFPQGRFRAVADRALSSGHELP